MTVLQCLNFSFIPLVCSLYIFERVLVILPHECFSSRPQVDIPGEHSAPPREEAFCPAPYLILSLSSINSNARSASLPLRITMLKYHVIAIQLISPCV